MVHLNQHYHHMEVFHLNILSFSPLDGMDESATYIEPAALAHGTPRRRPVSVIALNGEYVSIIWSESGH